MSKGRLSNEDFFVRLSELFASRREKDHGSIYLTQKRLTHPDETTTGTSYPTPAPSPADLSDLQPLSDPLPILIRATDGKSSKSHKQAGGGGGGGGKGKVKLSTIVKPDDVDAFFARYGEACKAGMSALKKRDRSGRKKKAKKRKGGG